MVEKPNYFQNEDAYDSLITKWKKTYDKEYGVIIGLNNVKGLIAQESGFDPNCQTWEANVKLYSYGLMQLLDSTVRGMGWNPSKENIYDPDTNLKYGMKYLYEQYKRYKKYTDAYAGYNAGSVKRDEYGKYINQYYVDIVSSFASFYYYRDIIQDYDRASVFKTKIQEQKKRRSELEKGMIEDKENAKNYTVFIFIAVVVVVLLYFFNKGKLK